MREKLRFIEQRYTSLAQRFGASPEDIQEIDEQIVKGNVVRPPTQGEDDEAQIVY
jgi:hypothetical protein